MSASSSCSNGYTSLDDGINCYKLNYRSGSRISWESAKRECEQTEFAQLLSITDPFEQAYMRLLTYSKEVDQTWIGLYQETSNLNWKWTDSRAVTYTNWGSGVNITFNISKSECVYLDGNDGKWRLASCSNSLAYMCKQSLGFL